MSIVVGGASNVDKDIKWKVENGVAVLYLKDDKLLEAGAECMVVPHSIEASVGSFVLGKAYTFGSGGGRVVAVDQLSNQSYVFGGAELDQSGETATIQNEIVLGNTVNVSVGTETKNAIECVWTETTPSNVIVFSSVFKAAEAYSGRLTYRAFLMDKGGTEVVRFDVDGLSFVAGNDVTVPYYYPIISPKGHDVRVEIRKADGTLLKVNANAQGVPYRSAVIRPYEERPFFDTIYVNSNTTIYRGCNVAVDTTNNPVTITIDDSCGMTACRVLDAAGKFGVNSCKISMPYPAEWSGRQIIQMQTNGDDVDIWKNPNTNKWQGRNNRDQAILRPDKFQGETVSTVSAPSYMGKVWNEIKENSLHGMPLDKNTELVFDFAGQSITAPVDVMVFKALDYFSITIINANAQQMAHGVKVSFYGLTPIGGNATFHIKDNVEGNKVEFRYYATIGSYIATIVSSNKKVIVNSNYVTEVFDPFNKTRSFEVRQSGDTGSTMTMLYDDANAGIQYVHGSASGYVNVFKRNAQIDMAINIRMTLTQTEITKGILLNTQWTQPGWFAPEYLYEVELNYLDKTTSKNLGGLILRLCMQSQQFPRTMAVTKLAEW